MRITSTQFCTSDHRSDGLDATTNSIRPLSFIPDYDPSYIDPEYRADPYWHIQIYNQHELHFYGNFNKQDAEIEPDYPVTDGALNDVLRRALLDPWQTKLDPCASPAQDERKDELYNFRPQVSLTTQSKHDL